MNRRIVSAAQVFGLCLTILLLTLFPAGCSSPLSRTFFTADTVCTVTLYDGNRAILDEAVDLCNALSEKLDCHAEDSAAAELNRRKTLSPADSDVLAVAEKGLYYSKLSNGVFDITVRPVSDLWDFKAGVAPSRDTLAQACQRVDYRKLSVTENALSLSGDAEVDFGGIAKGYIADRVEEYLRGQGVTSAIINLGGNVTVIGKNNNKAFSVGIQTPFGTDSIAALQVSDCSVVTSGIYQRYFEQDGVIYHHLLDPRTGMPVQNGLRSVTIIAPHSVDADALSTLCFLLGKTVGSELIRQTDHVEAVWIDAENQIELSDGLVMEQNKIYLK